MQRFRKSGFTLLELLITIGIITTLSTLVFVIVMPARKKAADVKRKIEISQIGRFITRSCYLPDRQAGLPTGVGGEYDLLQLAEELKTKYPKYADYLSTIPRDYRSGTETESFYKYLVTADGKKCALYANLENEDESVTLTGITVPTPGGGSGVLEAATSGWNGTRKYFQVSN